MAVATFDTLKFANTLKAAGVPPAQAEAQAFAEVMQLNLKELVTKDNLKLTGDELKREIDDAKKELKQEIAEARREAKQDLKEVEQRLAAKIELLAAEQKTIRTELKADMYLLRWMLGVGVTVGVGVLIRLFVIRGPIG